MTVRGKQNGSGLTTALLVAVVIAAAFSCVSSKPAAPPSPPSPKSAGQIAKETKEAEESAARTRMVRAMARGLRDIARDPDSLKFSVFVTNVDATEVCAEYRARNGFGGVNREIIVLAGGKKRSTAAAWNKYCPEMAYDMLSAAR